MMKSDMNILRLNLASPLRYLPLENLDPFAYKTEDGETLFCFELDVSERLRFEPDRNTFLGALVFGGQATESRAGEPKAERCFLELPCGFYLFSQKRELLNREDIITMAIEIQAEGLWQRLKPGVELYLRYLFEDGSMVTQLFRPYTE